MKACAVCGRVGLWDEHHLTGVDHNGEYLDPEMTVPLCHDHHELIGDDTKTLNIEVPDSPLTEIEKVALRLRRLSVSLARIGSGMDPQPIISVLLEPLTTWADTLGGAVKRLDQGLPEWRQIDMPGSGGDDTAS